MTSAPGESIFRGIGLRLLAVALMTTMSAVIKLAETHGANLAEILFFRQTVAVPIVMAWLLAGPGLGSIRTRRFGAHALRTAVGLTSMVCNFASLLLLPLAEATTLQFTAPIFATVLGALILHEPTGWHRWAAVLAGFLGVLIVVQPGSGHFPPLGAIIGLTSAVLVGVVSIQLRQIGQTEGPGTTVFWFSLLSVPVLAVFYLFQAQPHDAPTWALLLSIGVLGGAAQLALTAALRQAPVAVVVPMDYSTLVWATLYGWLLFGVWPTWSTLAGAPIIIASGLYIVWREHRRRRERTLAAGGAA